MKNNNFASAIYTSLRQVPKGKVTTYKLLAGTVGTRAYRTVGQVLKNNPYAPEVPCHRVVRSDGLIGGFNGNNSGKSVEQKRKMLQSEGIMFNGDRVADFEKRLHCFAKNDYDLSKTMLSLKP